MFPRLARHKVPIHPENQNAESETTRKINGWSIGLNILCPPPEIAVSLQQIIGKATIPWRVFGQIHCAFVSSVLLSGHALIEGF
jgi:hypothetical protein